MAKHEYTKRDKKTLNRVSVRRPTLITVASTKGTWLVKEQLVVVLAAPSLDTGEVQFFVFSRHRPYYLCYNPTHN